MVKMQKYNLKTIQIAAYNPFLLLFFVNKGNPQCQKINVNSTNTKIILTLTSTIGLLRERMCVCMS